MSGRRGLGVKADDLLDQLVRLAAGEIRERNPEMSAAEVEAIGRDLAVGALRYFMLRFGRTKVVAFDFAEAMKFQGETGPYLQNSLVRCRSIFRKLQAQEGLAEAALAALDPESDLASLGEVEAEDEAWDLVLQLGRADEALLVALSTLELAVLARWAFQAAQRFHKYYERYRILGEPDPARRLERAVTVWLYMNRLGRVLEIMGIPVPGRM
jgi:arginyl-tRNA synthetase